MTVREVVVIGAGVIGVTTAHALREDGHQVTLLEAEPAAGRGTSHANGGFLSAGFCAPWAMPGLPRQILSAGLSRQGPMRWRPDFSTSQLRWLRDLFAQCTPSEFADHRGRMVRLALLSRACLRRLIDRTQVEFDFQSAGVMQIMRQQPAPSVLSRRLDELRALGMDAQWCDAEQVRALEPGLSRSAPLAGGLQVRDDASGDCEQFVQQLLAWNCQRGLNFVPGVRVDALEMDRSGQRLRAVRSGGRRWDAQAFVFATGVDSAHLLGATLRVPVVPVKGYSVTLNLPAGQGPHAAVIDDASKLAIARMGSRVRLAGMAELVGYRRDVDPRRCEQLIAQYEALYGPVDRAHASLWAGLRPMTADGTPIIGPTHIQGLYLNTGHGTYGWTLACGSAQLLADLIANRPAALEPSDYTPQRLRRNQAQTLASPSTPTAPPGDLHAHRSH